VVTHGRLGQELVKAAGTIVEGTMHIKSFSLGWHNNVEKSKAKIAKAVESVDKGKGVIILTDMFGGTPSNLSLPLLEKGRLEIITGVNLPMVIKLANQSGKESLEELASKVKEQGQSQIVIASQLLGE
ncbi:MAG: PTS sugar transporter subunit IIA, partial [bacterium]